MMIFHMISCALKMFRGFGMRIQGSSKERHQMGVEPGAQCSQDTYITSFGGF
ncbi:hypothetical protein Scep_006720 [Stephania cephalantha]|uniref:Uncharacterized protein n=1 Tax=Stephania cephalantha TaxID=152367 RepID=A0AAP0KA72_9MAGN